MNGVNSNMHSLHKDIKQPDFQHMWNTSLSWKWENLICRGIFFKFQSVKVSSTKTELGRCRLWQLRCQSTGNLFQYGRWFVLVWIAFTDSITKTISRTWLSDNPASEMCFLNLVQARLFPTGNHLFRSVSWNTMASIWVSFIPGVSQAKASKHNLHCGGLFVVPFIPNILIIRQHFCVGE